jgi:hypothetical protein
MTAFDDLRIQLLESVDRRTSTGTQTAYARLWARWRGKGVRRGVVAIAIPLVFVAAAAATIVTQAGESPTDALFARVLGSSSTRSAASGPCRIVGGRHRAGFSDEAPDRAITAVLPELARGPSRPASKRVIFYAEHNAGGTVLARTIREVHLPNGITLVLYVAHGQGPFTAVEPQHCLSARLATLAKLSPDPHRPVRQAVARKLRDMPDTDPRAQSLTIADGVTGGSASVPLLPENEPLRTGIFFSGSGCDPRGDCAPIFYSGIAGPKAAYLTLTPAPRAAPNKGRVRRRVAVVQGLFAFTLPRDTGVEILTERARDGKALTSSSLQAWQPPRRASPRDQERGSADVRASRRPSSFRVASRGAVRAAPTVRGSRAAATAAGA